VDGVGYTIEEDSSVIAQMCSMPLSKVRRQ